MRIHEIVGPNADIEMVELSTDGGNSWREVYMPVELQEGDKIRIRGSNFIKHSTAQLLGQ